MSLFPLRHMLLCSISILAIRSTAHAQACLKHQVTDPSVPECADKNGKVLSGAYPAMAVSVSDVEGGPKWVKSFVQAVIEAEPDKPPQFILNVNGETFRQLKQMVNSMNVPAAKKALYLSALTQSSPDARSNWQQDFMVPVVDENGRPSIRPDSADSKPPEGLVKTELKQLSEICKIPTGPAYATDVRSGEAGTFGGNISGGPNGSCVVGTAAFKSGDWQKLTSDICGPGSKIIEAPTSFLKVGHTDEIFSAIRTGPGKCDVAILVASTTAATDALRDHENDKALELASAMLNNPLHSRKTTTGGIDVLKRYSAICDSVLRARATSPHAPDRARTVNQLEAPLLKRLLLQVFSTDAVADDTDPQPDPQCAAILRSMTNGELLKAIEGDANLNAVNKGIQSQLTWFEDRAPVHMADAGCPTPRMAEVGSLFMGEAEINGRGRDGTDINVQDGVSIFPNLTNLQQFGNTILAPDPGNEALRKDFIEKVKGLGPQLKVKFLDTQFAHLRNGNLHCSTNAVRYCRPTK